MGRRKAVGKGVVLGGVLVCRGPDRVAKAGYCRGVTGLRGAIKVHGCGQLGGVGECGPRQRVLIGPGEKSFEDWA